MSEFMDMLVGMLPIHSEMQKKDNQLRKVLDRSIGEYMDTFEQPYDQLFLDTATGGWLDAHGRDYGVPRRLSEDDESYENIEANAYAWWDDSINEKGPHIQITEGLVALLIPIAAMYLRGLRGKKLVVWINHFANKMVEFDGNIPIGTRELGKAMLAEIIAHETAHIIKKHGPVKARYA